MLIILFIYKVIYLNTYDFKSSFAVLWLLVMDFLSFQTPGQSFLDCLFPYCFRLSIFYSIWNSLTHNAIPLYHHCKLVSSIATQFYFTFERVFDVIVTYFIEPYLFIISNLVCVFFLLLLFLNSQFVSLQFCSFSHIIFLQPHTISKRGFHFTRVFFLKIQEAFRNLKKPQCLPLGPIHKDIN